MGTDIKIKRVYENPSDKDGLRILVDKLWPRGLKKSEVKYDLWIKEIAPSNMLRTFFHKDIENNWLTFKTEYIKELNHSDIFSELITTIKSEHPQSVTLLYAFKDKQRNHALIIKEEISKTLSKEI